MRFQGRQVREIPNIYLMVPSLVRLRMDVGVDDAMQYLPLGSLPHEAGFPVHRWLWYPHGIPMVGVGWEDIVLGSILYLATTREASRYCCGFQCRLEITKYLVRRSSPPTRSPKRCMYR